MVEFFNAILEFLDTGIYTFFTELYAWLIIKYTTYKIGFLLTMLQFSWDVAKEILVQLSITQEIENALATLPPETVSHLSFFNVISGINLILNAAITRFVMRFTGL